MRALIESRDDELAVRRLVGSAWTMYHAAATGFQGTPRFDVQRRIGQGAVGVVYEARDREHDTRVALKTLHTLTPEGLLSLKHEFRTAQDLRHPNLVSLGELMEADGTWFFTMELLSGAHFTQWVRPESRPAALSGSVANDVYGPGFDEARLRSTLKQLVDGLNALHTAGKVHRDIKPSNVLVTPEGRLVILDFGLTSEFLRAQEAVQVAGTAAYMAPEQVLCAAIGPAADWYAVGVMLYQGLTGRLPFAGTHQEMVERKVVAMPVSPRELCAGAPEDLSVLCLDLLRTAPAERPSGVELARRVGLADASDGPLTRVALVGRRGEREVLYAAFAQREQGRGASVLVSGESGVGKSFLVRAFLDDLRARHPDVVVLGGRCYEREAVPYKAVDAIIDQLSQLLRGMPESEVVPLLPDGAVFLARAFPVLKLVEDLLPGHTVAPAMANPREVRQRVFAALRELFCRLARARPVVLAIDDLQWADDDSFELLHELMNAPCEPTLLLVATLRAGTEARSKGASLTHSLRGLVKRIELTPLATDEAAKLAEELLRRAHGRAPSPELVRRVVEDAKGHPLFIEELVRVRSGEASALRLDDALWQRVSRLDDSERRLLELLAVAGGPITRAAAVRAAAIDFGRLFASEAKLRAETLVRMSGAQRDSELEPYHDRVRESVLAHLSEAQRADWHVRLACALEQDAEHDPESVAVHWASAGRPDRAADYYLRAANHAEKALAFERAARLYEEALGTGSFSGEARQSLLFALSEALGNAGRLAAAADVRLTLSESSEPVVRLELRHRAAQQLMCSGHFERGTTLLRETLGQLGIYNPGSRLMLILAVLGARLRLRLRGLAERPRRRVTQAELMRVDACWAAGQGFAMNDNIRGAYFHARCLLAALQAGEPDRLARALGNATISAAAVGVSAHKRIQSMLGALCALSQRLGSAESMAYAAAASGFVHFNEGGFALARQEFDTAEALFREQCVGKTYEVSTLRGMLLRTLFNLGEIRELAARTPAILRQAEQQRDLYMELVCHTASSAMLGLCHDDLTLADRALQRALGLLEPGVVRLQHYWAYTAECQVALYRGQAREAHERMVWLFAELKRALLTQVTSCRMVVLSLRGRAAVARALAEPSERASLLRAAERDAGLLEAELVPWGKPAGQAIRAGVAMVRGERAQAMQLYAEAARGYDAHDMALFAAGARRLEGQLRADAQGEQLVRAADARFAAQGVLSPERMTLALVGGIAS